MISLCVIISLIILIYELYKILTKFFKKFKPNKVAQDSSSVNLALELE